MSSLSSRAVHLVVPSISLAVTVAYLAGQARPVNGYSESAVAQGLCATFVPGAVMAAVGAWEAGRLRRADVGTWSRRRSWPTVVAHSLTPTLPLELAVALVGPLWLWMADGSALPSWRALAMVASSLLVVVGAGAMGFGLGSVMPPVVAPALALVGCYAWMVLPYGFEPLWLRHLSGSPSGCCMSFLEIDPGAAVAPGLVGVALMGAGMTMATAQARLASGFSRRAARWGVAAALTLVVAGAGLASLLIDDLGPDPVRPRTSGLECVPAGTSTLCLWAEDASERGEVAATVARFRKRLGAVGVDLPATVTEQDPPPRGAWLFSVTPPADAEQVAMSVAVGLIPQQYRCDPLLDAGERYGTPDVLFAWIMLTAGSSVHDVNGETGPVDVAQLVTHRPASEQAAWFEDQRSRLVGCVPGTTG